MKLTKNLRFIVLLLCCSVLFTAVAIDAFATDVSTRLVYVKALSSGDTQITTVTQTGTFTFTVPASECYSISPNNKFVFVGSQDTVTSIKIYDLISGVLEIEIPRTMGTPCGISWKDNQHLLLFDSRVDETSYFYLLDLTTSAITGPEIVTHVDFPDGLETAIYVPSPDGQNVVMLNCVSGQYISDIDVEVCSGEKHLVIYSIPDAEIVYTFEGVYTSYRNSDMLRKEISWSPSGRYIAHPGRNLTDQWEIFDTASMHYLNLTIFPSTTEFVDSVYGGVIWSPDETKISFWVDIVDPGPGGSGSIDKLAIYDLVSSNLQIFPTWYNRSGPSAWAPDSQSVLVSLENGDLVSVALDGTETLLDQNVETPIMSWVNLTPTANAGVDQNVNNTTVTLDGTASFDPDSLMVTYSWSENVDGLVREIATGVSPQVQLGIGVHTITLTVTDDDGATATDEVIITVK